MSFFKRLFGKSSDEPSELPSMPWDEAPSICDHVRSHIDPSQPGLTEGGETLPDEQRLNEGSQIQWAAGAMDGVMGHHMGQGNHDELVNKAVELVLAYCESPTAKTKLALYEHVIEGNTLPLIDPILEALVGNDQVNHDRLYEIAYSFVTEAPDREPMKFGIAILGLYRNPENEVLFQEIGRHEEFTLYCAVALSNLSDDSELSLWTLARNVDGWGRIHVVERLKQTERPEIKNWLLREGYRNSVMYEYLAYTCATGGGLLAALSESMVDRKLLTSAGEILSALIAGGPAENIDDYEDGAVVVEMYLGHMESSAESLADYLHVHAIKQFLGDENADWNYRVERGWTEARREGLSKTCSDILERLKWANLARHGLNSDDEREFHRANQVVESLDIDTWETHWRRLQQNSADSGRWYHVMIRCNDNRIPDVIVYAEQNIDLKVIATGPAEELGIGPGWEHHQCLDFVLQDLHKFPGHGQKLIQAGLRSPAIRNRNMAIAAISAWGHEHWDHDLRAALVAAAKCEPDYEVRERMEKALRGEPLED